MIFEITAYAKINLALRITGKRADGFHDLETIFQRISLHDVLKIREADHLTLSCSDDTIPVDDTNLAMRAARALATRPVAIHIDKHIPAGGGLGGGSSDAAATLLALDRIFALRTPPERLKQLALSLGSDVPFFLVGGTAYATGRGEELTPMPGLGRVPLLLVLPEERVSTRDAFAGITRYSAPVGVERFREALASDVFEHSELLTNDFEETIFAKVPQLAGYKQRLLDAGAMWAGMSGSGSTIVGAFRDAATRNAARAAFTDVKTAAAETV